MFAISASHRRAADCTRVSSTVCKSNGEREMTLQYLRRSGLLLQRFVALACQLRDLLVQAGSGKNCEGARSLAQCGALGA